MILGFLLSKTKAKASALPLSLSLFFFLLMWTILKAVEFVTVLFLFYVVWGGVRNVGS